MRFSEKAGALYATVADIVRLIFPRDTSDALKWETQGYEDEDDTVQVFHGVGFAARPRDGANAEAVAVAVNAGDHHVIVATRDAALLDEVVKKVSLGAGHTLVFSDGTVMKLTSAIVEIKSHDGTAVALSLKADVDSVNARVAAVESALNAFIAKYNTHTHPVSGAATLVPGPTFLATPSSSSATINGTTVLRGE